MQVVKQTGCNDKTEGRGGIKSGNAGFETRILRTSAQKETVTEALHDLPAVMERDVGVLLEGTGKSHEVEQLGQSVGTEEHVFGRGASILATPNLTKTKMRKPPDPSPLCLRR